MIIVSGEILHLYTYTKALKESVSRSGKFCPIHTRPMRMRR